MLYAVCSGVAKPLTRRVIEIEGVHNYGDTWIVVDAASPEDALEQTRLYDVGLHPAQTEMEMFAAVFNGMDLDDAIKWAGWDI